MVSVGCNIKLMLIKRDLIFFEERRGIIFYDYDTRSKEDCIKRFEKKKIALSRAKIYLQV